MNKTLYSLITAFGLALAAPAMAQDHSTHGDHGAAPAAAATSGAEAVMTVGEVTRVDARGGKLTIRHEEIRNLDMPAMTMVFGLKDATQVAGFKPGDKVLFHAEENGGALSITRIRIAE
ncbi:copper-binding protein [Comamonas guangdongensis]|uniref:Copper-binding protein n=1 Tax=Comamonas guangdongensis TaxID=510515 RepID=A0ABV3ZXF1_9BURK